MEKETTEQQLQKHSLARRLAGYKKMHEDTAQKKDCVKEFMSAETLTQARKILWGVKKKAQSLRK